MGRPDLLTGGKELLLQIFGGQKSSEKQQTQAEKVKEADQTMYLEGELSEAMNKAKVYLDMDRNGAQVETMQIVDGIIKGAKKRYIEVKLLSAGKKYEVITLILMSGTLVHATSYEEALKAEKKAKPNHPQLKDIDLEKTLYFAFKG